MQRYRKTAAATGRLPYRKTMRLGILAALLLSPLRAETDTPALSLWTWTAPSGALAPKGTVVHVNQPVLSALLKGDATTVSLALDDSVSLTIEITATRTTRHGGRLWTGSVQEVGGSSVSMVYRGGKLAASIHTGSHGIFDVTTSVAGRVILRSRKAAAIQCPMDAMRGSLPRLNATSRAATSNCDDGTVIDVMVVYTSAALNAAGGRIQIENLIDIAMADTNMAFNRSGIDTAVNLVHTQQVDYVETGQWQIDGPRLFGTEDGFLDEVHALRDLYGADCCSLWVHSLNVGGIGYFPDGSMKGIGPSGFGMVRLDNATLLTPAHEFGHNLYCAHDRPNALDTPFVEYAYGYTKPDQSWRTIMSVAATPLVIPHFANPDICWPDACPVGDPTGIAVGNPQPSDTVLAINEMRHIVANFRPTRFAGGGPVAYVAHDAPPGGDGSSWATAFQSIADAACAVRGAAGTVTEVWVKAGTYHPGDDSGDRSSTFTLIDGARLLGGFSGSERREYERDPLLNETILSGDIGIPGDASDNAYHVVTVGSESATLDGFVIQDGNADGGDPNDGGGGILVLNGTNARIVNCDIRNNRALRYGAGVYVRSGGGPFIEGCTIRQNVVNIADWPAGGGGVYHESNCTTRLQSCVFEGNQARLGSGMANFFGSSPTLDDCRFTNHRPPAGGEGGAVYNYSFCNPVFERCIFERNGADVGGAVGSFFDCRPVFNACTFLSNQALADGGALYFYSNCLAEISNAYFAGNVADTGGAISNQFSSHTRIVNSTMAGNQAISTTGGMYSYESDPVVSNALLWLNESNGSNDEPAQLDGFNSTPAINYSTIQGWTATLGGSNNNGEDPVFADLPGDDHTIGTSYDDARLTSGSPAINSGSNALIPGSILTDLAGIPRVIALDVDRGALEFSAAYDADGDGDRDLADHMAFANCLSGPDAQPTPAPPLSLVDCLLAFDADGDNDVDLIDGSRWLPIFADSP